MGPLELVEQLVMIAIILAWLAWILGFAPLPWFRDALYFGTPVPLLVILVLRLVRYRRAVREAEDLAEQRSRIDAPYRMK